jgi:hypothetical protein
MLQPSRPKPPLLPRRLLREAIEDVYKFGEPARLFRLALDDAIGHTPFDVELEYRKADSIQRRFGCRQLLQKLHTQSRLLNHPTNASNLPLDAVQPRHQ